MVVNDSEWCPSLYVLLRTFEKISMTLLGSDWPLLRHWNSLRIHPTLETSSYINTCIFNLYVYNQRIPNIFLKVVQNFLAFFELPHLVVNRWLLSIPKLECVLPRIKEESWLMMIYQISIANINSLGISWRMFHCIWNIGIFEDCVFGSCVR